MQSLHSVRKDTNSLLTCKLLGRRDLHLHRFSHPCWTISVNTIISMSCFTYFIISELLRSGQLLCILCLCTALTVVYKMKRVSSFGARVSTTPWLQPETIFCPALPPCGQLLPTASHCLPTFKLLSTKTIDHTHHFPATTEKVQPLCINHFG